MNCYDYFLLLLSCEFNNDNNNDIELGKTLLDDYCCDNNYYKLNNDIDNKFNTIDNIINYYDTNKTYTPPLQQNYYKSDIDNKFNTIDNIINSYDTNKYYTPIEHNSHILHKTIELE